MIGELVSGRYRVVSRIGSGGAGDVYLADDTELPRKVALRKTKGQRDIVLMTGPHLGGFNQPISLPELIDFAAAGAARCVAGRFCLEQDRLS